MNLSAVHLQSWLDENSHLLKPPVGNYCLQRGGFTTMIVGGPNERTDFHINPTPEWFYQYKGPMALKVVTPEGKFEVVEIPEGGMYLLPPNTPHGPVRFADTVGVVLEQDRPAGANDKMRWYCEECSNIVYEVEFYMTDLGTQVKAAIDDFMADEDHRTCPHCGFKMSTKPTKPLQRPN